MALKSKTPSVTVATLTHDEATRRNIPTAEYQSVMQKDQQDPVPVTYARGPGGKTGGLGAEKERRNGDLDPQLVWRGKDQQDWSYLVVHAPPLYIQEKVHPKVLIDDLLRGVASGKRRVASRGASIPSPEPEQLDLFSDFNGIPKDADKTEFYRHDQNWSNRMILGDSLQVMASLAEREGLRGKVQCIYLDPPYGIKFNSNFQWSTTSRDVKDGNVGHITREPEQVKAFRDTWREGIHSYLTYLRDRLTVARDLLADSGSIFVQIGQQNCHLIRLLLDEVFGADNFVSQIIFVKTAGATSEFLSGTYDVLVFYAKSRSRLKYHQPLTVKEVGGVGGTAYKRVRLPDLSDRAMTNDELAGRTALPCDAKVFRIDNLTSQSVGQDKGEGAASWFPVEFAGQTLRPSEKVRWKTNEVGMARLLRASRLSSTEKGLYYVRYFKDFAAFPEDHVWSDTGIAGFASEKRYVVETSEKVIQRCFLMTTDPGDLILDPTCGSGTTAYVAEQWGRRWITIDTSRVALALARARIMGARYPYYLLADSRDGQVKEAEVSRSAPSSQPTHGNIRHGFVYERVPHITLKSIANNTEIDVIWDKWQATLEPLRERLNAVLVGWVERSETHPPTSPRGDGLRSRSAHPTNTARVPAPFEEWQVPRAADPDWPPEARELHADWWTARIARQNEIDASIAAKADSEYLYDKPYTDNKKVRVAGPFTVESLSPHRVLGVDENDDLIDPNEKQVADPGAGYGEKQTFPQMILENLKAAGVQQAHKEDRIVFTSLAPWPGDLVCADGRYIEGGGETGTEKRAAIFIGPEFGTVTRPDLVTAAREAGDADFDCLIACAFNYEAHATDPYKALKTTLKAEIDEEAWASLNSDTSRPFPKPASGRIAVKVINHLGDEAMKVFRVA
jgi:adenine-specific DNA-methyltransferase